MGTNYNNEYYKRLRITNELKKTVKFKNLVDKKDKEKLFNRLSIDVLHKYDSTYYNDLKKELAFNKLLNDEEGKKLLKKLYIDVLCKYEISNPRMRNSGEYKNYLYYIDSEEFIQNIQLKSNQLIIFIDNTDKGIVKCVGSNMMKNKFKNYLAKNTKDFKIIGTQEKSKSRISYQNSYYESDTIDNSILNFPHKKIEVFLLRKDNEIHKKAYLYEDINVTKTTRINTFSYFQLKSSKNYLMIVCKGKQDFYKRILLKLRNAIAHTRIELNNNYIIFKDKDTYPKNKKYNRIKIKDDKLNFIAKIHKDKICDFIDELNKKIP